jgi:hypothetical protein
MNFNCPHDILNAQLKLLFPEYKLLKKNNIEFVARNYLFILFRQLFWNIKCFTQILRLKDRYIFREFDKFAIIYLLLPQRVIVFNVNHNLQGTFNKFLCYLLSNKFDVFMIDPPIEMQNRFKFLKHAKSPLKPRLPKDCQRPNALVLVGNREEQKNSLHEKIDSIIVLLNDVGYSNIKLIGKNAHNGVYLEKKDYEKQIGASLTINLVAYNDRHSGTIWFLKLVSPNFLQLHSNVAAEQISDCLNGRLYRNYNELQKILSQG